MVTDYYLMLLAAGYLRRNRDRTARSVPHQHEVDADGHGGDAAPTRRAPEWSYSHAIRNLWSGWAARGQRGEGCSVGALLPSTILAASMA